MSYASPLRWPSDVPRHKGARTAGAFQVGPEVALNDLDGALRRFGATSIVITADAPVGARSGRFLTETLVAVLRDPGVSVFMKRKGRDLVFALDRYSKPIANLRALTLALEGIRTVERFGGPGMEDRALAGFAALPATAGTTVAHWSVVLGASALYEEMIGGKHEKAFVLERAESLYRGLARKHHSDVAGGAHEAMVEINRAIADARKELAS